MRNFKYSLQVNKIAANTLESVTRLYPPCTHDVSAKIIITKQQYQPPKHN